MGDILRKALSRINFPGGKEMLMIWKILIITGIVILALILIIILYASIIAKKDGHVADKIYGDIAVIAKNAANTLEYLRDHDRTGVCRVSRGILGIRIEIASEGDPPIHFDQEIRTDGRTEADISALCEHTASTIVHFTKHTYQYFKEYGDSYKIDRNTY